MSTPGDRTTRNAWIFAVVLFCVAALLWAEHFWMLRNGQYYGIGMHGWYRPITNSLTALVLALWGLRWIIRARRR